MSTKKLLLVAVASVGLGACQQAATHLPGQPSFQHRVDQLRDWRTLAVRTAAAIETANLTGIGAGTGYTGVAGTQPLQIGRPIYIHNQDPGSAFGTEFARLLEQELLQRGKTIARESADAVVVNMDASTFLYGEKGKQLVSYASFWTTLPGLGLITNVENWNWSDTGAGAALLAVGPILDVLAGLDRATNAEVLITTSVLDQNFVVHRGSEVVYVRPSDLPLFWGDQEVPPLATQSQGPPLQATTIRVQR